MERGVALKGHVTVAGIEPSNTSSLRRHRPLGFREIGRLPKVGSSLADSWILW